MHMYRLQGTHYEIGAEYGSLLQASRFPLPPIKPTQIKFAQKCEKRVEQVAPELLEELRGMIDGSSYNADHLKALALTLNIPPACSIVAVSGQHTADGKTLFGRNHDWYYWYARAAALVDVRVPGTLSSIGGNDLFIGRHDGMNEAGLAIGITDVAGGRHTPGVMFPLAVRHVLNTCRTTEEAAAFLEKIPYIRNTNFLIADASGTIAIVEASPQRAHVTFCPEGFAAVTNHFQSEVMAPLEKVNKRPLNSSQRLFRLRAWFRNEPLTMESLQKIMGLPYPAGMWNDVKSKSGKHHILGTVWSWTTTLGEPAIHFAEALPQGKPNYKCIPVD